MERKKLNAFGARNSPTLVLLLVIVFSKKFLGMVEIPGRPVLSTGVATCVCLHEASAARHSCCCAVQSVSCTFCANVSPLPVCPSGQNEPHTPPTVNNRRHTTILYYCLLSQNVYELRCTHQEKKKRASSAAGPMSL